jgi:predicted nucleic acid-binding protein
VTDLAALLDASVIIPASPNDTLLLAAEAGLFRVYWSADILEEVERNLVEHQLTTAELAAKRIAAMRRAFPGSTVAGYHDLVDQMTNHPEDRHVLAAAVAAEMDMIVTTNLRDVPDHSLYPYRILARSPDDFLIELDDQAPARMTRIVRQQASNLRRPPMSPQEVLDVLALHAPQFAERLASRF